MSDPTHKIQALLTQIENALHQVSPPIPYLVWGEGIVQSRQALQQVRDYLLTSLQTTATPSPAHQETLSVESSEILSQQLSQLQKEIEALSQQRQRLMTEIQQLQTQHKSALSAAMIVPEVLDNSVDSPQQNTQKSLQNLNLPDTLNPQDILDEGDNLSDLFGELQLNQTSTLDGPRLASNPQAELDRIQDATVHLEFPEPSLDGQEYTLASPHESLLPVNQDEDQVDSLLLVGHGTLQRLESELMSLEELSGDTDTEDSDQPEPETVAEAIFNDDDSTEEGLLLQQLYTQFEQHLPQLNLSSESTPQTLEELLEQSDFTAIPAPTSLEAESFSLEELSQKFSTSNKTSQKPAQSED
ncbi:MAG: hypothetical protein WBA13_20685 [Microcoleaceae cyanobacterium]